jgi:plastocyanin
MKRSQAHIICSSWMAMACLAAACGGGEPAGQPPAAGTAAAAPTDTADGPGIIAGVTTFEGTAPAPRPLPMDSDPRCAAGAGATSDRLLVGAGNTLQNVFVYVKDGLGQRTYPTPATPVLLDQKGCRYVPHVLGVQVGQTLSIANSDPTVHNVNASAKNNRSFNFGQVASVPPVARVFDKPEVMVPFRCDVHGWMIAYVGVVVHPFFAVSNADGTFEIKGLPAGTFTLEAWHELLGVQSQSVTVDGQTPAKASFAFKAPT